MRRVCVANALGDELDPLVGVEQKASCLGHSSTYDPIAGAAPSGLCQQSGHVGGAASDRLGDVGEGQAPQTVAFDEAKGIDDDAAARRRSTKFARADSPVDFGQD